MKISKYIIVINMRQTHIDTIAKNSEETGEYIKAIKTQNKTENQYPIVFNIFIQKLNNGRFFTQITIIIKQLKRMTTHTQITCMIYQELMLIVVSVTCSHTVILYCLSLSVGLVGHCCFCVTATCSAY